MLRDRLILATLSFLAAGCSGSEISTEISRQAAVSGETRLDLRRVAGTEWERVCFLGPYSSNAMAKETLGFSWNVEARTSINSSDAINVLVFVKAQEVVAYAEHPRHQDFWRLSGRCFARDQAVFVNEGGSFVHGPS